MPRAHEPRRRRCAAAACVLLASAAARAAGASTGRSAAPPTAASTVAESRAFGLDALLALFAAVLESRASFVERRDLALTTRPLESRGELAWRAPDRLEKRVTAPRAELLAIHGDLLVHESGERRRALPISAAPEAAPLVTGLRAVLAGDRRQLEQGWRAIVLGEAAQWDLTLLPSDPRIAALVTRVRLGGSQARIGRIELWMADGDRSTMTLGPPDPASR